MVIVPIVIQFSCGQILIGNALHSYVMKAPVRLIFWCRNKLIYICFNTITDENHPPKAHAGGDKIITLPVSLITLDGRESTDDRGIVSYSWTRDDKSLAAGVCYVIFTYSLYFYFVGVLKGPQNHTIIGVCRGHRQAVSDAFPVHFSTDLNETGHWQSVGVIEGAIKIIR